MQETQETQIGSLGWEVPLQEEMATPSSILAWKMPWTEKPGRPQSMGLKESDTTEQLAKLSEGSQWERPCIVRLHTHELSRIYKSLHRKQNCPQTTVEVEINTHKHEETFWSGGNILKLDHGDGCRTYKFPKNHWVGHLQWANLVVCKLYFSKVFKNKSDDGILN